MKLNKNKILNNYFLLLISLMLIEVIFRLINKLSITNISFFRTFLGVNIISIVLSLVYSIFPKKISKVLIIFTVLIDSIYSFIQILFLNFLGVYMSFNTVSQVGAVKNYIFDFLKSSKGEYYLVFLPFIICLLITIVSKIISSNHPIDFKLKRRFYYENQIVICALLIIFILSSLTYYNTLNEKYSDKYQVLSLKELFLNVSNPSLAIKDFGITSYALLDLKSKYVENEIANETIFAYNDNNKTRDKDDTLWLNVINNEQNTNLNTLNRYFIDNDLPSKNAFTGKYKNKNLIVIMMESVNDIIINEEYFPNFYSLYSSSYYFKNNYSPRNSCATGNNEFSAMTSLYSIYNNCTSNLYVNNIYPQSIFNLFNNKGYITNSFHDYDNTYYERTKIHPNMGSQNYYDVNALNMTYSNVYGAWPSDVTLMEEYLKKLDDISGNFMSYITTVTTHQPYSSQSEYGDKYLDKFENASYSLELKRYLSKMTELDNAIGVLIDGLKERNLLDDTIIVLFGDHYPYAINLDILNEILDRDLTNYENEKVPLIIYDSSLKETITMDEYTSYINILPTMANLFDLDYDPRYYMGNDLFSEDYQSLVVFYDYSWKNEYAYYNASRSNIEYYTDKTYTIEELQNINNKIDLKIKMSSLAIKNNYFNYLYNSLNGNVMNKVDKIDNKQNES